MAPTEPSDRERDLLEPASAKEWRAWLTEHAAESTGVWLAVGKKGGSRTTLTYDEAVEEALCFGWIDSVVNRLDADRFMQRFTPRKPASNWSGPNKVRVARLIAEGRMTTQGLAAIETAKANGSWTRLNDVEAERVPDDLRAALDAEPGAAEGFSAIASSARKQAIYWVMTAKRADTRAKRIEATVQAAVERRAPR